MQIINTRQQFIADHSSTSYFFYSAKPLSREARAKANTLSSHVDVGPRTAEITYHGEFADLGPDRRDKFLTLFDVEVRESYDWWTLSVMLERAKLSKIDIADYASEGEASLMFEKVGQRVCLQFDGWHMDYDAAYGQFGQDFMEGLAELGLKLRAELYAGKTDALEVMRAYCTEGTILRNRKSAAAKMLASLLEVM